MRPPADDAALLREFVTEKSEPAFAELVGRYTDLVYAAASRQTGRADLAEDVTQAVFILLARKAPRLSAGVSLAGWLHKVTRYTALNTLRTATRRRVHERRAAEMAAKMAPKMASEMAVDPRRPTTAWAELAPLLDEGIARLGAREREAVVLRFLQQHSFARVGKSLGISEEAAQMRVTRGVEKLRGFLRSRGVAVTAAALGTLAAANAAPAAPPQLAGAISGKALCAADAEAARLADAVARAMTFDGVRAVAAVTLALLALTIGSALLIERLVTRAPQLWQWPRAVPAERSEAVAPGMAGHGGGVDALVWRIVDPTAAAGIASNRAAGNGARNGAGN